MVVVSAEPTAASVQLVVMAFWFRAGVGVPPDAWLFWLPLERTALAPSLLTPVMARTWTAPELLEPVATVTTVLVVLAIRAVRMNTDMR